MAAKPKPPLHPNMMCASGTEHGEQVALFAWAAYQARVVPEAAKLRLFFAVHNQGHGDAIRGAQAKAEGVKKGVSDTLLPVRGPGGAGLWIELKKRKGGSESEEQAAWGAEMRAEGYAYMVARGWREAARALMMWLEFDEAEWPGGEAYL